MDQAKFEELLGYFTENGITLPTDVRNAIEDVFHENDNVESVICYHIDEAEEFQNDLKLTNEVNMYITGKSSGVVNNVWTYYGGMQYSLSEYIRLLEENGTLIEDISKIENDEVSLLYNLKEYVVVLLEKVSWETPGNLTREQVLYIYCPESLDEGDPEEDRYDRVYNQVVDEYGL